MHREQHVKSMWRACCALCSCNPWSPVEQLPAVRGTCTANMTLAAGELSSNARREPASYLPELRTSSIGRPTERANVKVPLL